MLHNLSNQWHINESFLAFLFFNKHLIVERFRLQSECILIEQTVTDEINLATSLCYLRVRGHQIRQTESFSERHRERDRESDAAGTLWQIETLVWSFLLRVHDTVAVNDLMASQKATGIRLIWEQISPAVPGIFKCGTAPLPKEISLNAFSQRRANNNQGLHADADDEQVGNGAC